MSFQVCHDTTEAIELCERYRLYLKPMWKIKISVQLPTLKTPGQAISSWEVMEKLRNLIKPDEFITLKVSKTNLVLIQFECEVQKKSTCQRVLQKLQTNCMKLSGFADVLKIRAAPAKLNYPSRHDWDSFFRDAKNVDEMKPGERPDTIYVQNLPTKWFSEESSSKPSEYILKKVFEAFGDVREVSIPSGQSSNPSTTFGKISAFNNDLVFDAYIQYKEYISFVKAMDSLKGMKLLYKSEGNKSHSADIKVDFDKTKYLSDRSIQHRAEKQQKRDNNNNKDSESSSSPVLKTTQPKVEIVPDKKHLKLKKSVLSKAKKHRGNEAKCLMKALLQHAEIKERERKLKQKEEQIEKERQKQQKLLERALEEEKKHEEEGKKRKQLLLQEQERMLREKLLKNLQSREQQRTEALREKLRKEISGKKLLKSVLVMSRTNKHHNRKQLKW